MNHPHLLPVYPLFPIEPQSANGAYVTDREGHQYLDFYGGHAVISIGHSHPTFKAALKDQIDHLVFYSNSIENRLQGQVAEKLLSLSGLKNDYDLFFINSGAEANENAIKLASMANGRKKFIVLENGFHGRTAGAIALTDKMKHRTAFSLNAEIIKIQINDEEALEKALSENDICAVIAEAIQGIGGIQVCNSTFLDKIAVLTKKHGAFWIADEIQCGFGRSGDFFAFQKSEFEPDFITMAKGMGNGFPVGGILIKKGSLPIEYGMAGTTFGGNHLACRATLAVLEVIQAESLINNAREMGNYLSIELAKMTQVKEVRGRGLMLGIDLGYSIKDLRKNLIMEERVFTGSSSDPNIIRLLPPLNIKHKECDQFLNAFNHQLQKI